MKSLPMTGLVLVLFGCLVQVQAQSPIMHWDFEKNGDKTTVERISGIADTLEGNFEEAEGVKGTGIRLDGFTTCIRKSPDHVTTPGVAYTVEAWVALGNYPWNWCPILTTESEGVSGYRLMLGPLGQVSLQSAIDGQWVSCASAQDTMPLRKWMHVVGVYQANHEMTLYVNGTQIAACPIQGTIRYSQKQELKIGMVASPGKPSDIHRTWGTVAAYYGIDGIIDEVKVHDKALSGAQVSDRFQAVPVKAPDIAQRKLPTIEKHPKRFGAFYTKLKYYPGWDNLWPVEQDPDVVVCFEKSPVKLMFWRGIRYGASWVSENNNWMTDQSVEAWSHGDMDTEGCFEHMQDRHCRLSHVRIIENTDARVVVHWRYALVSANNNTWRPDPKTGWECWIDEYYTIYPDATGTRRVSWKKGSLGHPRQFQESLALLHPGQSISDLLETDFASVADYDNNTGFAKFVDDPSKPPYGPFNWDNKHAYTIQRYNFKSEHKPFICFEPGNSMVIRHNSLKSYDKAGGCNHFPVG
ncbi:MAG: LamG domain-containing protein, partial [Planctomycetes bacterium]|nr:LamG domain-containing protein [Planctomycetota bacterium]